MARASAKKKPAAKPAAKPAKAARSDGALRRWVGWVFSPLKLCVLALCAAVWLFWPQVRNQLPQLDELPEYQVTVDRVQVTPPPRWVPEDIVEKVFERAGFEQTLVLTDPQLSEKIALAFHTHPWIERLVQVRKSFPARVTVDVVYREPVAMVEVPGGGYYPIDRFGYLLPNEDFSAADVERYPLISNISSVPAGNLGESWGDPAVTGAAELAAVLTASNESGQSWWSTLGLKSIIAPRRMAAADEADDLQYRLATSGGSQIYWGRSPTTQHPGEISVVKKLERIADYHQTWKGFDNSPTPILIDIRPWQGSRRTQLAAEPGPARQ
ncbi:MAG: hypothetical protein R3C49_06670 [Planctomycetaceae bacterium]